MQILQAIHFHLVQVVERFTSREPRRESRVIGHPTIHRFAANRIRFPNGLLTLGGVDDKVNLIVFDHIHYVRSSFANLVDAPAGDTRLSQRVRRPLRGEDLEATLDELTSKPYRTRLIAVTHTDEAYAVTRQRHARSGLSFGIGLSERPPGAHDLTRGLHLRPQNRVSLGELIERKYCFLH